MESGTLLHLALLKKISHISPTPHNQMKYSDYRKRQSLKSCVHYESEKRMEAVTPLAQAVQNRNKINTVSYRQKKKRANKGNNIENITISAWSIKSIEPSENVEDDKSHRYTSGDQKKYKIKPKIRNYRNMSQVNSLQKAKLSLFKEYQNFIPDYVFKRKNLPSKSFSKSKNFPLKHTSINYAGQQVPESPRPNQFVRSNTQQKTTKLSSYEAFVNEMKFQARKNKLQH